VTFHVQELEKDAGVPPGDAAGCDGQCVPLWPLGWYEPVLLWSGPMDQAG
jgi:hypothetical protein